MSELYDTIFKRKSVRRFDMTLDEDALFAVKRQIGKLVPLIRDINVRIEVVPRTETTAKFGEYCLLFYSEKKPGYLLNAGYMLEQMDLFLAARDIGACWYGLAKAKRPKLVGMDHVIMMAFGQSAPEVFRQNISDFKRMSTKEIWRGDFDVGVKEAIRLAPSACNTQPWRVVSEDGRISVFRETNLKAFIPATQLSYFNSIDMGIGLLFLETALLEKGYKFDRKLKLDETSEKGQVKIAEYTLS
ncbi:MAG: nitroreductase [Clostridia bacterium]|nr:nitroreductase [Clostridia bacterium]NCC68945.1 nitroreductase [Clostridia bacterium]